MTGSYESNDVFIGMLASLAFSGCLFRADNVGNELRLSWNPQTTAAVIVGSCIAILRRH